MDFTDVPMLKIWPILADTYTDINIGASLICICTYYYYYIKYTLKSMAMYNLVTRN